MLNRALFISDSPKSDLLVEHVEEYYLLATVLFIDI